MTAIILLASAVQNANSNGAGVDLTSVVSAARLRLTVSAVTGTNPTLTVTIEHSDDNSFFRAHSSFTTVATIGVQDLALAGLDRYVRVKWAITGTVSPSFTFSVKGTSFICYANLEDMVSHAVPNEGFGTIPTWVKSENLLSSTSKVNSYIKGRYTLPLSKWGDDLREATAILATYGTLSGRGLFRDAEQQKNLQLQRDQTIKWLEDIRDGKATPDEIVDSTPAVNNGSSVLFTRPKRGWGT